MNNKKPVILFDIDYTIFDTALYKSSSLKDFSIYEEVKEVIKELGKRSTIGIFSEGEITHQLSKLVITEIKDYFHDDNVHIFSQKLSSLPSVILKYEDDNLFFIDDKLTVLRSIKELKSDITTIWIKRGIYAKSIPILPGFHPDYTVVNLREVIKII